MPDSWKLFTKRLRYTGRMPLSTRTFVSIACFFVCVAASPALRAQDANKIIEQYVKAIGGSKVASKIQTLTIEGTATVPSDEKAGTYTFNSKLPNRYYTELIVSDKPQIIAYNGKSAWQQSADGEISTLLGNAALQVEAAATIANGGLLRLKKEKVGPAFIGHANVRGKDALQIELTNPAGIKTELYFDASTHLLLEQSAPVAGQTQELYLDDYRPEGGLQVARKLELHRAGNVYRIAVTRVSVNGVVGERVFDFPKKQQVELPDLKQLFKEIDDNQKAIDKIREKYSGHRSEEETQYDNNGKVSKVDREEYDFFYLNGEEVSTLVGKNGNPLSPEEQNKENEKTRKHIEELQKKDAKQQAKEEKDKEEGKDEKDDDDPGIEVFLRASQFVNPRRERFRGQDCLVFDFEPNPEFKAHKMSEKIVQKLAGVIWIDEKALDVVRLEAYFVGDFRIAAGVLANLQKGTSFTFEQAYLNNEVWLPTYEEAHLGVKVLMVKGFKVNAVTRYSDYKRFNVDTLNTIAKPNDAAPTQPGAKSAPDEAGAKPN